MASGCYWEKQKTNKQKTTLFTIVPEAHPEYSPV